MSLVVNLVSFPLYRRADIMLNQDILDIVKELKAAELEGYDGLIIHGANGRFSVKEALVRDFTVYSNTPA